MSDLLQKWHVANTAALSATLAAFDKSILAINGQGEPTTIAEAEEVRTLRAIADDLFELAIARASELVNARRPDFTPDLIHSRYA